MHVRLKICQTIGHFLAANILPAKNAVFVGFPPTSTSPLGRPHAGVMDEGSVLNYLYPHLCCWVPYFPLRATAWAIPSPD